MIKPKNKSITTKVQKTSTPTEKKKENRGGARRGAGAKKKTPDKKRRGFYCWIYEANASKVGKGDWERGIQKIQRSIQKHVNEQY